MPERPVFATLHAPEPEVECRGKGKARQPYAFGVKVGSAVSACKGLIVRAQFSGHPVRRGYLGRAIGADAWIAAGFERQANGGDRGSGLSRPRGRWRASVASRQGQDPDATTMALDQTTSSSGTSDRTFERRLPVASLHAQRRPRRCATRARLRRRLHPALADALDRVFACLDRGMGWQALSAVYRLPLEIGA